MRNFPWLKLLTFVGAAAALGGPVMGQKPIKITADLTDAPRKLYHAEVDLPVSGTEMVLTTPKWIPGNHRPTGPVEDITGVVFTVGGKPVEWRRYEAELFALHVTVRRSAT